MHQKRKKKRKPKFTPEDPSPTMPSPHVSKSQAPISSRVGIAETCKPKKNEEKKKEKEKRQEEKNENDRN